MTDTTVTPYPQTPAEVASAVLDAIEAHPEAFHMSTWIYMPGGGTLAPGQAPECGTTLCAAGWAAHVTGWTLTNSVLATKDGASDYIENVATKALGPRTVDETQLFWASADEAIAVLREIAGR